MCQDTCRLDEDLLQQHWYPRLRHGMLYERATGEWNRPAQTSQISSDG